MRYSKARAGLRTGKACPRRWIAYDKQQDRERRKSSPRSYTTSSEHLEAAFYELKENAAPGVDGVTCGEPTRKALIPVSWTYTHGFHKGAYRALPSRRVYIPKPDGRQRPLAVAALEDKIVQRATIGVMNAIYEEDFLGFSYGFRPKPAGRAWDLPVPVQRASTHARFFDHAGSSRRSRLRARLYRGQHDAPWSSESPTGR